MPDQWRCTDQEGESWWSATWQSTLRWLSVLGADHCPLTGRQQLSTSGASRRWQLQMRLVPCIAMVSLRTLTAPPRTRAPRHPGPCLAVVSVSSAPRLQALNWSVPTNKYRPISNASTAVHHALPRPPGIPPPPSFTVPPAPQVPHDFVSPTSKAAFPPMPQTCYANPLCSLRPLPCCDPPGSQGSRTACFRPFLRPH